MKNDKNKAVENTKMIAILLFTAFARGVAYKHVSTNHMAVHEAELWIDMSVKAFSEELDNCAYAKVIDHAV